MATDSGIEADAAQPLPKCEVAADCPNAADPRCGTATCKGGVCGLDLLAQPGEVVPLKSQIRGDCLTEYCDATGSSLVIEDSDDVYSDGKPCTVNGCKDGVPFTDDVQDGEECPGVGDGFCLDGECVECTESSGGPSENCGIGNTCDEGRCASSACGVGMCGDTCPLCTAGSPCDEGSDCRSSVCDIGGTCALPACGDTAKNGGETGLNCGGGNCPACAAGEGCEVPDDCISRVCWIGKCLTPTCEDGIQNGDEKGIDCGNQACGPCLL